MDVRARGPAGRPDVANDVAFAERLALGNREAREMAVAGTNPEPVVQDHEVAEVSAPPGADDGPVSRRANRLAFVRRDIETRVEFRRPGEGIPP